MIPVQMPVPQPGDIVDAIVATLRASVSSDFASRVAVFIALKPGEVMTAEGERGILKASFDSVIKFLPPESPFIAPMTQVRDMEIDRIKEGSRDPSTILN